MLHDYKLGLRMLLKFPGLTVAGGLGLAMAIGVGAGWYDLSRDLFAPTLPLPDGDRIVLIETENTLTSAAEPLVAREFLEWQRERRTIQELGAYHPVPRTLTVGDQVLTSIQSAEVTASAFRTARVAPVSAAAFSIPTRPRARHR